MIEAWYGNCPVLFVGCAEQTNNPVHIKYLSSDTYNTSSSRTITAIMHQYTYYIYCKCTADNNTNYINVSYVPIFG